MVRQFFGGKIGLDPCSNQWSLVGAEKEFALPANDGLKEDWGAKTIYVNPPYERDKERGTTMLDWFEKIAQASSNGAEVVSLVPVATNTKHWKQFVYPVAKAICFLYAPRLKFYSEDHLEPKGAPMACCLIYYGDRASDFAKEFKQFGAVVALDEIALP